MQDETYFQTPHSLGAKRALHVLPPSQNPGTVYSFPDGDVKEVSLGEHASCYKGAVSLPDRKHPVRHLVAVSEELYTNGGVGRTILLG